MCSSQISKCGTAFSLYFRDEIRTIDFVLVWDEYNVEAQTYRCTEYRRVSNYAIPGILYRTTFRLILYFLGI